MDGKLTESLDARLMCKYTVPKGVWGHALPEKLDAEITSDVILEANQLLEYF